MGGICQLDLRLSFWAAASIRGPRSVRRTRVGSERLGVAASVFRKLETPPDEVVYIVGCIADEFVYIVCCSLVLSQHVFACIVWYRPLSALYGLPCSVVFKHVLCLGWLVSIPSPAAPFYWDFQGMLIRSWTDSCTHLERCTTSGSRSPQPPPKRGGMGEGIPSLLGRSRRWGFIVW